MGFDPRVMKIVMAKRRKDAADLQEEEALVELYWDALNGTECATRAPAREAAE